MANPGKIEASDWNAIQTTIARVLGAPDGSTVDLGYNIPGSITSGQQAVNETILGSDWNTLRTDVNIAITNQTGSASGLVTKGTSDIIFSSDFTLISGQIATANANRLNVNDGQLTFQNGPDRNFSSTWTSNTTFEGRIAFGSNARFRGFWNAGGKIVFSASRSGGSATNHNTAWTNLLSAMGSITLRSTTMFQSGQSQNGSFPNTGASGVYGNTAFTTGYVTVFSIEDINNPTPSYRPNDYRIDIRFDSSSRLSATYMDFRIVLSDDHLPIGAGPDFIDGTLSLNCDIYYPFTNSATGVSELAASQS
jgi:hypothetical protein